ncbi:hypothetical protein IAR55_002248 [Kwoniella newhampshirensis]|uniref:Fe2OG dioxygenase domain-containing protein n=1 Tax=Kwoniella newhampshirensis TaxID=1651941 RepID=A0AAW0YS92_9TREE
MIQTEDSHEVDNDTEIDTDTKIALLASLLEPITFPIATYVEALATAKGDVARAAEELLLPRVKSSGKRKAGTSLQSWLIRPRNGKAARTDVTPVEVQDDLKPQVAEENDDNIKTEGVEFHAQQASSTNLWSLLREGTAGPSPTKAKTIPQPPVVLTSQKAIDAHSLPLTLLDPPLTPSFASALYLAMMEESDTWEIKPFLLAGRWVTSTYTTGIYKRENGGYGEEEPLRYYYSGIEQEAPRNYPPILAKAADIVEQAVNEALSKRDRYPLEWAGSWKANLCGVNRYTGAASTVGWHADQLTYLGPYTTIASLSLGTPRAFRLRQTNPVDPAFATSTKPIRTYEVTLGHNTLCLMNAGCQERVPPQKALDLFRPAYGIDGKPIPVSEQKTFTSRINITFRFYREDFHPNPSTGPTGVREGIPLCKCGSPTVLRADQKAKARSRLAPNSPSKTGRAPIQSSGIVDDDMLFFWQCQSPTQTGELKGCGFFKILDMKREGRGPCCGDL